MKNDQDSLNIPLVDLLFYVGLFGYLAIQIFWMPSYLENNPQLAQINSLASGCVGFVAMSKVLK